MAESLDNKIQLIKAYDGRVIGTSDGKTFRKTIKGSSHLLRCPPAIAIDALAYEQIAATHERIEVTDAERGTVYWISVESFESHKEVLERGHGEQFYVRLRYWQCKFENGVRQLSLC